MVEQWALLDAFGTPTGEVLSRSQDAPVLPKDRYHLVSVIWVYAQGHFLLQRRSARKTYGAGSWSIPGGAVMLNESSAEGAARELAEETGIVVLPSELEYLNRTLRDDYICDAWLYRNDAVFDIQPINTSSEVDTLAWADIKTVEKLVAADYLSKHNDSFQIARERTL